MIFSFAGLHPDPIQKLIDRISREKKNRNGMKRKETGRKKLTAKLKMLSDKPNLWPRVFANVKVNKK